MNNVALVVSTSSRIRVRRSIESRVNAVKSDFSPSWQLKTIFQRLRQQTSNANAASEPRDLLGIDFCPTVFITVRC